MPFKALPSLQRPLPVCTVHATTLKDIPASAHPLPIIPRHSFDFTGSYDCPGRHAKTHVLSHQACLYTHACNNTALPPPPPTHLPTQPPGPPNSAHTYIHTYIPSPTLKLHTSLQATRTHTHIYTYIHTYILTYTHTHIHTYLHTHTHTYKHGQPLKQDKKPAGNYMSLVSRHDEVGARHARGIPAPTTARTQLCSMNVCMYGCINACRQDVTMVFSQSLL